MVSEDLLTETEKTILCPLYKSTHPTADKAIYELFCKKNQKSEYLPPTSDCWWQHVRRCNYQVYLWKQSLIDMMDLANPEDTGWQEEEGALAPVYLTKPPAPASVTELTSCGCKTSCRSCKCSKAGLPCTDTCSCADLCENTVAATEDSDHSDNATGK